MLETALTMGTLGYFIEKAGGKECLVKILGPSCDSLGQHIGGLFKKNILKITSTSDKLVEKNKIDKNNNPNISVMNEIYLHGLMQDNEVYCDYYGGVLASSKFCNRNDIGKTFAQKVGRLSSYSLRLHYIIYSCMANIFHNKKIELGAMPKMHHYMIFIPMEEVIKSMDFDETEKKMYDCIITDSMLALSQEGLIHNECIVGDNNKKNFNSKFTMPSEGIVVGPSIGGATLLIWAAGYGLTDPNLIFSDEISFDPEIQPELARIHIPYGQKIPSDCPFCFNAEDMTECQNFENYLLESE